jgi:hypothetical protein
MMTDVEQKKEKRRKNETGEERKNIRVRLSWIKTAMAADKFFSLSLSRYRTPFFSTTTHNCSLKIELFHLSQPTVFSFSFAQCLYIYI